MEAEGDLLADLVDYVLPMLPPYDFTLYVLLVRTTEGQGGEVRLGKRTIASLLGKGTRASRGNYQHISEKLDNLAALGFIRIGETSREGTQYHVALPRSVPAVRELVLADEEPTPEPNHFQDPALRRALMDRDGWRCHYCAEPVTEDNATLDHIVPQYLGGPNTPDNLTTACLTCNSIKSGRTYEEAAPDLLAALTRRRNASP